MISPIPTVMAKAGSVLISIPKRVNPPSNPYAYLRTNGMIRALDITGGTQHRYLFLRRNYVPRAPRNVASVPKITSGAADPIKILAIRHPSVTPGTAAVVK